MLRRLFTLAPALSLLLCAATAVLWVRSHGTVDTVFWNLGGRVFWRLTCASGRCHVFWVNEPSRQSRTRALHYYRDTQGDLDELLQSLDTVLLDSPNQSARPGPWAGMRFWR